jgi:hypothetical protein
MFRYWADTGNVTQPGDTRGSPERALFWQDVLRQSSATKSMDTCAGAGTSGSTQV